MHFLILSMMASVSVAALLKISRQRNLAIEQMVATNYVVATALTCLFLQPNPAQLTMNAPTIELLAALGVLLPTVFIAMSRAVAAVGIVRYDAAQRLSLFLPILASFTIFGEQLQAHRVMGLVIAVMALACLLYKRDERAQSGGEEWLLAVWLGFGIIDILYKQLSKQGAAFQNSLVVVFVLAGLIMFTYLLVKKMVWQKPNILAGLLLGCLNFMNILFYIKAHQAFKDSPTIVFAGMNMGVIALGTLVGLFGFGERVSKLNWTGVALAVMAIVVLYFGEHLFA